MADFCPKTCFFMGANTPNGFVGYPQDFYRGDGWQVFLIKAGPGMGKSSMLRRLGARMEQAGEPVEAVLCSSDPHSLDGLIFPTRKQCIFDATAPHVIEPRAFGLTETVVSFGDAVDSAILRERRAEITEAARENANAHKRVRRLLGAAAALATDTAMLAEAAVDGDKVVCAAERFAAREFGAAKNKSEYAKGAAGARRFLSAVTPDGYRTLWSTVESLCPRAVAIEDAYGAVSTRFLRAVEARAQQAGVPFYAVPNPLAPEQSEHLLFPTLGVALLTERAPNTVPLADCRRIHAARFADKGTLKAHRQRFAFNRRAQAEMLEGAVAAANEAKVWHDRLEAPYIAATDWKAIKRIEKRLWERLQNG